jgi:hypothetical protein
MEILHMETEGGEFAHREKTQYEQVKNWCLHIYNIMFWVNGRHVSVREIQRWCCPAARGQRRVRTLEIKRGMLRSQQILPPVLFSPFSQDEYSFFESSMPENTEKEGGTPPMPPDAIAPYDGRYYAELQRAVPRFESVEESSPQIKSGPPSPPL